MSGGQFHVDGKAVSLLMFTCLCGAGAVSSVCVEHSMVPLTHLYRMGIVEVSAVHHHTTLHSCWTSGLETRTSADFGTRYRELKTYSDQYINKQTRGKQQQQQQQVKTT